MSLKAAIAVTLVVVALSPLARADETETVCFASAAEGQKARKAGKLGDARQAFTRCAEVACPSEVTARCTAWIAEIDDAMPSIIVATKDAAGHDLAAGTVHIDQQEQSVLAGQTVSLEPGQHVVALDVPGEPRVEEALVLREHEKNRLVLLQLRPKPAPPIVHKPTALPFVLGGIGLVFGAAFGAFAVAGFLDRQSSHCDSGCVPNDYDRVRAELVTADASLGVAAVLLVTAIIDFAITRSGPKRATAHAPFSLTF
jgi:hypothetical protein